MLFNKKKIEDPQPVAAEEPQPVVEEPAAEPFKPSDTTYIGKGITFYGDFVTSDKLEINGAVEGDVKSSSLLTVTEGAAFKGSAAVDALDLSGTVDGSIDCSQLARLTAGASMTGTLNTRYLQTEPGSYFEGDLNMHPSADPAEPVPAAQEDDIEATEENIFEL